MVLQMFSSVTFATENINHDVITAEIVQPNIQQENRSDETVISDEIFSNEQVPTANTRAAIWATTNKTTNLISAPYANINTTIASLPSGSGFYIIERDYTYFYVYRVVNGKYQRGYVNIADVNYSSYSWVDHNIFEKGVTKFTADSQAVLSGPGTTNTYEHIGSIYKGESPLLILRTELNTYNNVTYAFIQYKVTSTGKFKRGWVPYSAVKVDKAASSDSLIDNNSVFYLESVATRKMIQAATSNNAGDKVSQQPSNITNNTQLFKIEKASTGYYRFILQSNTKLSLQVVGNQMAEGTQLGVNTKGTSSSPTKAEEFEVKINDDGSFSLASRCTGRYRSVDLYGGNSANGTKIISSLSANTSNQRWYFQPKIKRGNDIAIIKVGDSTGKACVSMYNAFNNNLNVYYASRTNLDSTANVSKNSEFNLPHIKFAIKNSSVFYINGHGYPEPKINVNGKSYTITPSNIGFATTDRTRWGILSPCNQLNKDGSAIVWAKQALRNGVRGILGYYDLAPKDSGGEDDPQPKNIAEFASKLSGGKTFIASWKAANDGFWGIAGKSNWAAIYHATAESDTLSSYNSAISSPSTSTIYYYARNTAEGSLSTAAVSEFISTIDSVKKAENFETNQSVPKEWKTVNEITTFEKTGFDIGTAKAVTTDKDEALSQVGVFIRENNIQLPANLKIEYGNITKSRLSYDETCFVEEKILAHTYTVKVDDISKNVAIMYFEVTDDGVVNFMSQPNEDN